MIRPLKMAVFLLSVHLLNQFLLHLYPTHSTDHPIYFLQDPVGNFSYGEGNGNQDTLVSLPGESHGTEEPGRLQSVGLQTVGHD